MGGAGVSEGTTGRRKKRIAAFPALSWQWSDQRFSQRATVFHSNSQHARLAPVPCSLLPGVFALIFSTGWGREQRLTCQEPCPPAALTPEPPACPPVPDLTALSMAVLTLWLLWLSLIFLVSLSLGIPSARGEHWVPSPADVSAVRQRPSSPFSFWLCSHLRYIPVSRLSQYQLVKRMIIHLNKHLLVINYL